jgi:hypothetical protein
MMVVIEYLKRGSQHFLTRDIYLIIAIYSQL